MLQNTDLCTQLEYSHVISNAFRDGKAKSFVVSLDNVTFHVVCQMRTEVVEGLLLSEWRTTNIINMQR
jgi:hypothetical protein